LMIDDKAIMSNTSIWRGERIGGRKWIKTNYHLEGRDEEENELEGEGDIVSPLTFFVFSFICWVVATSCPTSSSPCRKKAPKCQSKDMSAKSLWGAHRDRLSVHAYMWALIYEYTMCFEASLQEILIRVECECLHMYCVLKKNHTKTSNELWARWQRWLRQPWDLPAISSDVFIRQSQDRTTS
jgi:hypothetical protein